MGNTLRIEVSFTDGANNDEEVTSAASSAVVPATAENCSAEGTVRCTTVTAGHGTRDSGGDFRTGLGMDIGTEDESFGTIRCLNSDSDT